MKHYYNLFFYSSGIDPLQWVAFGRSATNQTEEPQIKMIHQIIIHPMAKTKGGFTQHDFTLIELSSPFEFGDSIKPVCLAESAPVLGQMCVTAGWSDGTAEGKAIFAIFNHKEY